MSSLFNELATSYEGLEAAEGFQSPEEIVAYRLAMLERSVPQADLVARNLAPGVRALEVGCGNGRLLMEFARRGVISGGLGIDLAASRVAFATRWAEEENHTGLRFEVGNVFEVDLTHGDFGLGACITGALAYFDPVQPGSARRLLKLMHNALEPGGRLVLELYPHPELRPLLAAQHGAARLWQELPESDPWRYYLSDLRLEGDVLTHAKTFVHRHDGRIDTGRRERLVLYTPEAVRELVTAAGFVEEQLLEGWTDAPYAGGGTMVVTALRP